MVRSINILPDHVINKIAAGEVVERPASVVKELIENSIDAGATEILIEVEQAGRRLISVTDNGNGMSKEDAHVAFERHATSKITTDADLDAVRTMGFRGEALASIASVAQVRMLTAEAGSPSGTQIEIEGGTIKAMSDAAARQGTSVEISHLFYNTPARLKFLKSPATEFSHVLAAVSRQAMARPSIRFKLIHNKKPVLDLPSSRSVKDRAFQLYGTDIADNLIEFSGGRDAVLVQGLLGRPGFTRADKTYQDLYVNHRAVKSPSLTHALYGAYGDMLMRDRHPVGFLFVEIDPALVDVNVHPAKAEVRFRNQSHIHDLVRDAIREGLGGYGSPGGNLSAASGHRGPVYADRVREAIADFGLRNEELKQIHPLSFGDRAEVTKDSGLNIFPSLSPDHSVSHSAIHNPQSALLLPLAQIHDSFIIAQSCQGMAIIDQHAAHERVLFEKLQEQYSSGAMPVQHLLIPVHVELGPAQSSLLVEYLPELNKLGLMVEDFGSGHFVVKAVPSLLGGADYKKLLLDILDEVNIHGKSRKVDELRDEILSVMACHPAIKIHRKLDAREMEKLLADLFVCSMPHTCPHGRPTVVRFSIDDIKKMFKRI